MDAQKDTGLCPGCEEAYKVGDLDDEIPNFSNGALSLPAPDGSKGMMRRNQNGEFDHNKWLFETQGTYGYGNAYWPDERDGDDGDGSMPKTMLDTSADIPWKPLSRVLPMSHSLISPYRFVVFISCL